MFVFKKALYDFKTPSYENDVIALSKNDIQALKDLKIENTYWQKIVDIFVCNCFLGLRYSDLKLLKKHHFVQDESGQYYIKMENKKTGITVEIPVLQTSMEILTKYDFDLKLPCSQYFNREIKNILKHYDLFGETVIKKRKQLKMSKEYPVLRRQLITSHSCRRTFITLAIDANVPLNSLMLASGHTKIQTVKKYMKMNQNADAFKGIEL